MEELADIREMHEQMRIVVAKIAPGDVTVEVEVGQAVK